MTDAPSPETQNLLRLIVTRTTELAPLKTVATKAIQLAEDESSAAMDLANGISSDQALTASLLRLSNSAYYGYARRISNVREAVILLGMRTVRSVAIASSVMDALRIPEVEGFDQDLFWAHSVCVGLTSEAIARETRVARPEDAFTAGVLHDVGKLAMMLVEPKRFAHMVRQVADAGMSPRDAEALAFDGVRHALVGARLAKRWRFPGTLSEAIGEHHPEQRPRAIATTADIVAMANSACNATGLACGFDWTRDAERKKGHRVAREAQLAIEKVPGGITTIELKAHTFLRHVSSRPPRWYATEVGMGQAGEDPEGDAEEVA